MKREAEAAPAVVIFAVQHFCLHDGPGVRSVVFFKGCPLRCSWCQNPESWRSRPELGFKAHLCIGCQTCVEVCEAGARRGPGLPERGCRGCFACADLCPAAALVRIGEARTVADLVAELVVEAPLYRESGGGVTLSGGEPTLHAGWAAELAAGLGDHAIQVAMETCGQFALTGEVERLLDHLDLVLFDLKLFDPDAHRTHCGRGNADIKRNLVVLAERAARGTGPRLWPRLPLIPNLTATPSNLRGWGELLRRLGFTKVTLVPYHELGRAKREWIGAADGPKLERLDPPVVDQAERILAELGITAFVPGEESWDGPGLSLEPT